MSVELVLPCLDEESSLPALLARVPPDWRVVVADNGSTDRTRSVAAAAGAVVVTEHRRGYGAAVHSGLLAASADIVVVVDGDGSLDPADLRPLVEAVRTGRTDLACGCGPPVSAPA